MTHLKCFKNDLSKKWVLIDNAENKNFYFYDGKVINKEKSKINVFKFDQIDFNLADY